VEVLFYKQETDRVLCSSYPSRNSLSPRLETLRRDLDLRRCISPSKLNRRNVTLFFAQNFRLNHPFRGTTEVGRRPDRVILRRQEGDFSIGGTISEDWM